MVIAPEISALFDLRERVVLVTGSGDGIGAGIVRRLHAAGARVAVHYATQRAAAERLARDLGERACVVHGDVERDAQRLCDDVLAGGDVAPHHDVFAGTVGMEQNQPERVARVGVPDLIVREDVKERAAQRFVGIDGHDRGRRARAIGFRE